MSVQTQIDRINQNVQNTYAVLDALGADMPTERSSDNLAMTAGTAKAVLYSDQTLEPSQQAQARKNIGLKLVQVQDYGAMGDGTTDDTTAFQNALAANRVVFVPGGTYKLSGELTIGNNCCLELSQDTVLNFTQTSGNCISLKMLSWIKGNHASVKVPYGFTGNVIYSSTSMLTSVTDIPGFKHWDPQWKPGRYITDLNILKADTNGLHYARVDGKCNGKGIYLHVNGNDSASRNMMAVDFSGLRIAGAFTYGIHSVVENAAGDSGYNFDMRLDGFIEACETGVLLEGNINPVMSVVIQPQKTQPDSNDKRYPYAKVGIKLVNTTNANMMNTSVWDWDSDKTLWSEGSENQHLVMLGDCRGAILNERYYWSNPNYDIRSLIYTNTPSNLEKLVIINEPFTRWFKPIDNEPYFYDGSFEKKLVLKEELDGIANVERTPTFTDKLSTAIDTDGSVFNGIGYYAYGHRINASNGLMIDDPYYGCTGFIPAKKGDTIYADYLKVNGSDNYVNAVLYNSSFARVMSINAGNLVTNGQHYSLDGYEETETGFKVSLASKDATNDKVAYIRFTFTRAGFGSKPVISVNDPIGYTQSGFLADGVKVKVENIVGLESGSGGGTGGTDGFSPIANVTQTSDGAKITITDKSGTTTATVKNGSAGANGTSVTHSWNGTTLTVTSASGTSSADLKGDKGDSIKGDKGDTGDRGFAMYLLNEGMAGSVESFSFTSFVIPDGYTPKVGDLVLYKTGQIGSVAEVDVSNQRVTVALNYGVSLIGPTGGEGASGKSAYQIALDNGFEGTETEWLESLKGTGGSGGAQPDLNAAPGEPGHVLNRTHYIESSIGEILPETTVEINPDEGMGVLIWPILELEVGEEYTVTWNGVEYKTVGLDGAALGEAGVVLGNVGQLTGEGDTGEPFVLMAVPPEMVADIGFAIMVAPLDGSASATVSIYGKTKIIHKLDSKYLPEGYPHVSVTQGEAMGNTRYSVDEESGMAFLNNTAKIITGGEYTVTWKNTEYVCVALDGAAIGQTGGVVLGNAGALTGGNVTDEPFVIAIPPADSDMAALGVGAIVVPLDGSTTGWVRIDGPVPTYTPIIREFLPPIRGLNAHIIDLDQQTTTLNANVIMNMDVAELQACTTVIYNGKAHSNAGFSMVVENANGMTGATILGVLAYVTPNFDVCFTRFRVQAITGSPGYVQQDETYQAMPRTSGEYTSTPMALTIPAGTKTAQWQPLETLKLDRLMFRTGSKYYALSIDDNGNVITQQVTMNGTPV